MDNVSELMLTAKKLHKCAEQRDTLLEACKSSTKWIAKVAADHDQGQSKYIGTAAKRTLKQINKVIEQATN